jgi:hypothetical protein
MQAPHVLPLPPFPTCQLSLNLSTTNTPL